MKTNMTPLPLTAQVPQLHLCQELQVEMEKKGMSMETLFYYTPDGKVITKHDDFYLEDGIACSSFTVGWHENAIPAPTCSELGELLWNIFEEANDWDLLYKAYGEVFDFKGTQRIGDLGIINLMRKPDMGAKMAIYLLKEGFITK